MNDSHDTDVQPRHQRMVCTDIGFLDRREILHVTVVDSFELVAVKFLVIDLGSGLPRMQCSIYLIE